MHFHEKCRLSYVTLRELKAAQGLVIKLCKIKTPFVCSRIGALRSVDSQSYVHVGAMQGHNPMCGPWLMRSPKFRSDRSSPSILIFSGVFAWSAGANIRDHEIVQ